MPFWQRHTSSFDKLCKSLLYYLSKDTISCRILNISQSERSWRLLQTLKWQKHLLFQRIYAPCFLWDASSSAPKSKWCKIKHWMSNSSSDLGKVRGPSLYSYGRTPWTMSFMANPRNGCGMFGTIWGFGMYCSVISIAMMQFWCFSSTVN